MHLRCISRNRIHCCPVSCPPVRHILPPRWRDMSRVEGKLRAKNTYGDTEKPGWHFYARGHVFVINRARCLTLGF